MNSINTYLKNRMIKLQNNKNMCRLFNYLKNYEFCVTCYLITLSILLCLSFDSFKAIVMNIKFYSINI